MIAPLAKSSLGDALLSVVIKTLNEEEKIGACIESVLVALKEIPNPSEIIIADSLSADNTVAVATHYPVKIVQFVNIADCGCGAGVQLGYQHSRGELILLLDGDMTLLPGFLPSALQAMEADPHLGGVAGLMEEVAIRNAFDAHRVSSGASSSARIERWLNGGGLYRRCAIESAGGYAADLNLKGWEEAELGMRLRAAGWVLNRLNIAAVLHDGHAANEWLILLRLWKSRRLMSNGILLKRSLLKPWLPETLGLLRNPVAVLTIWGSIIALVFLQISTWLITNAALLLFSAMFIYFSIKKRGILKAIKAFTFWHIHAAALLTGCFLKTVNPRLRISSTEIKS